MNLGVLEMKKLILGTLFTALSTMSFTIFAEGRPIDDPSKYKYLEKRYSASAGKPISEWREYTIDELKGDVQLDTRIEDPSSAIRRMDHFMGGDGGND